MILGGQMIWNLKEQKIRIWGGPNSDFGGTKRGFGPHKQNLRGQNNNFGGTNDLEFEGTKQGCRKEK